MWFRVIKPKLTKWIEANGSFADIIQDHHFRNTGYFDTSMSSIDKKGKKEIHYFALYENDEGEQLISRICTSGIDRRGGVKSNGPTLKDVAKKLEVKVSVLDDGEWIGEEE